MNSRWSWIAWASALCALSLYCLFFPASGGMRGMFFALAGGIAAAAATWLSRSVWRFFLPALSLFGLISPPISGRANSVFLLLTAAAALTATAWGLQKIAEDKTRRSLGARMEIALFSLIVVVGLFLRAPLLDGIPPGFLSDEAIRSLSAVSLWSVEKADVNFGFPPFDEWPLWNLMVAASTRIFGPEIAAARMPAVVSGMAAIFLGWLTARSLWGPIAGLFTSMFLAGSFWHVQYSRLALDPINMVAAGLLAGWLLLAPGVSRLRIAGLLGGAVCGLACYGYSAGLYLPVWGALVCGLRVIMTRRMHAVWFAAFFALGFIGVIIPGAGHFGTQLERIRLFSGSLARNAQHNEFEPAANLLAPDNRPPAQWTSYPHRTPRLSIAERFAFLMGAACLFAGTATPPLVRWALVFWLPLAIFPEAFFGESHLTRGIGALAPLSLLVGCAARFFEQIVSRRFLIAAFSMGLMNAGMTGWLLYGHYRQDPAVRAEYEGVRVGIAESLRKITREGPIYIYPFSDIAREPLFRYLLWMQIRDGSLKPAPAAPTPGKVVYVSRHPQIGIPVLYLVGSRDYPADRTLAMLDASRIPKGILGRESGP